MFYLSTEGGKSRVTELSFTSGGGYSFVMDGDRLPVLFRDEYTARCALGLIHNAGLHTGLVVRSTVPVTVRRING